MGLGDYYVEVPSLPRFQKLDPNQDPYDTYRATIDQMPDVVVKLTYVAPGAIEPELIERHDPAPK